MIKINSFTPVDNFTRKSWEFHDEYMVVKTKSLTFDYENEIRYEKIRSVQSKRMADINWIWASVITAISFTIISLGLGWMNINIPAVVEKVIVGLTLLMLIPALCRFEYYAFLDTNNNFLITVRVNFQSKPSILEAIKLIKQKTEMISETYFDDSLPNISPTFQYTEFDFADFFNKSKVIVYDDKIIDIEKSLMEEVTTVIRFDELSGKTKFVKMGNDNWDNLSSYWLFFICITGISVITFFAEQVRGSHLIFNLFIGGLALTIPLYLLRFIKSETLIFYDKQDYAVFWTRLNSANREKLNQIVEFVKGKVESQNQKTT